MVEGLSQGNEKSDGSPQEDYASRIHSSSHMDIDSRHPNDPTSPVTPDSGGPSRSNSMASETSYMASFDSSPVSTAATFGRSRRTSNMENSSSNPSTPNGNNVGSVPLSLTGVEAPPNITGSFLKETNSGSPYFSMSSKSFSSSLQGSDQGVPQEWQALYQTWQPRAVPLPTANTEFIFSNMQLQASGVEMDNDRQLIESYFSWEDPAYSGVSKESFLQDLVSKRTRYWSEALTSSIMARAYQIIRAWTNITAVPDTRSKELYRRSRELLFREKSTLETVLPHIQASTLLCCVDFTSGRVESASTLALEASRCAIQAILEGAADQGVVNASIICGLPAYVHL